MNPFRQLSRRSPTTNSSFTIPAQRTAMTTSILQVRAAAEEPLAQRTRSIGVRVSAASLKLRHATMGNILGCAWGIGVGEVEAVDVGLLAPLLQDVGDH
jgi:hypothetical protein